MSTQPTQREILEKSFKRAVNGGVAGSMAMAVQVGSMMWMRTTLNYQYKNGGTLWQNMRTLYGQGGVLRFYNGVGAALLQAPLSRFGDTAANTGVMAYLNANERTRELPVSVKTFCGSTIAGLWRINLMPLDTFKTMKQVHGQEAVSILRGKIKTHGIRSLYHGSLGACGATIIGHFPWFLTFNYLSENVPKPDDDRTLLKYSRYAGIGFCSSFVSDTVSNFSRVIKVAKQTSESGTSYPTVVANIIKNQGIQELFARGLRTKILINGIQGLVFTVIWKTLE